MDISIEFLIRAGQAGTADALREYSERRLSFALRRFAHKIQHVMLRLVDVNGPRRGIDSRCSITAKLVDGRRVFVEANAGWPFALRVLRDNRRALLVVPITDPSPASEVAEHYWRAA